ncbi:hypothetical protein Tco_0866950, partial [Tanacetum coccineum]
DMILIYIDVKAVRRCDIDAHERRLKGRKAHLLEDKQISSVGYLIVPFQVFCIWKAFGRNTRDLDSFEQETDKTTNLHQHLSRISTQKLETASQITHDAVTTHLKTVSQDLQTVSDDCAKYDKKKCSNPTSAISDETIANPNAQIVRDDMVRVQVPRYMAWLNYDEHIDSLSTMDNKVGVTSPKSTIQTLPSFKEYTSPVTYPKEVEKTLRTPIEVEPLNKTKLKEVGLNCNHNTPLSSREVPSFDKP